MCRTLTPFPYPIPMRPPATGATPLPSPAVRDITALGAIAAPGTTDDPPAPDPRIDGVATGRTVGGARAGNPPPGARPPRRRRLFRWLALVIVVVVVAGGWVVSQRINQPLAAPALLAGLPTSLTVPGESPTLPWPGVGQGAVSIPALRYAAQSGPESPVPIASLTKMTNALVVLRDHPLPPGASGPSITITAADVAEYTSEVHNDQSTIPVQLGEVLSERQMLEAMLTQSANNIAYSLALWDAGSTSAFVAEMNAMAVSLGANSSHYVDVSGYDPNSVSTAADCLRIAAAGMSNPTFAQVVGLTSITLPLMGTRPNIVSEIGSTTWSGSSPATPRKPRDAWSWRPTRRWPGARCRCW